MKPTFYRNDNGVSAVGILVVVTAYLFLASLIMSFLLINAFNVDNNAIKLPSQRDAVIYSNEQNFKNGSFELETIATGIHSKWEYSDIGATVTELGTHTWSELVIDNINPDSSGNYVNTYEINNSATNIFGGHNSYCILLRFTGGVDQNEVCISKDGFYIPDYLIDSGTQFGNAFQFNYPNAQDVIYPTIKTIYNDDTPSLEFYFNDEKMFETTKLHKDNNLLGLWGRYYGGISTFTLGFTLESFKTEGTIISGSNPSSGDNILGMMANLFATMLKIAVWSVPPEFLPVEFIAILIGLPEGIFIACLIIVVVRGVS